MKKEIFFFAFIFILILLQTTSFFPFNLSLFALFFPPFLFTKKLIPFLAIFTGILLDLFSEKPFYFYTLISLSIFFFIQFLIKKHVKV